MQPQTVNQASSELLARDLVERWALAWNQHDMELAAALLAPGVEFVTVGGKWLRGRAEFLSHHKTLHAGQMRESIWTNFGHESNALPGKLHVLQLEWGIRQDRDPDDTPRSPRRGHFTWIFAMANCGHILVAQNTNLRPGVKHRLGTSVMKERA